MLGNVAPRALRITSHPVVYSGRDNVTALTLEQLSGRRYVPLDLSGVTRWLLVFHQLDPQVLIDSAAEDVFSVSGGTLTVDLSGYALDASLQPCWLIAYDAEHPLGQVLVDDTDCVVTFAFREVSGAGLVPLPLAEYLTDAPVDGQAYVRKDGAWVLAELIASGVTSVNGRTGVVTLAAGDVGADPTGTASAAVAAHVASGTPHAVLGGVNSLAFNTAAGVSVTEGQFAWNTVDKTLDLGLPGGSVLQLGQELLVRVLNNTGGTLSSGDVIYITGASGQRLTAGKADPTVGARTLAMVTQSIANNQEGMATVTGLVRDFDTSAFAEGAELWLHPTTPGALTATRPSAPTRQILVGYCVRSHAVNGSLFIDVRATGSLAVATSDVTITSPAAGQVLRYNGSVWVNYTPTESITVACSDETTALTAGTNKVRFRMPYAFVLTGVRASLGDAQTSGSIFTVDLNEAGVSVLSTKLTVDNTEKTSTTAATPAVISDSALADDAEMSIDIDQVGNGTAKGLKVTLLGYKP